MRYTRACYLSTYFGGAALEYQWNSPPSLLGTRRKANWECTLQCLQEVSGLFMVIKHIRWAAVMRLILTFNI